MIADRLMTEAELLDLVTRAFIDLGTSPANAIHVAAVVVAAQRDGALSHGLIRMPGYAASLRDGSVDGCAVPIVDVAAPSVLTVNGRNGFAQVALAAARARACEMAASTGLCALLIRDVHHYAALWCDIEPFAEAGFVAVAMVNSRPHMTGWESRGKTFGTNPVAFACPRRADRPLVWDQASSLRAQGELLVAKREGHALPPGTGVDEAGNPTNDPSLILDGGALLPFAGAKGSNIAVMVEILVAALGGGRFGLEVPPTSGLAQTSRMGQFVLLLDPGAAGRSDFVDRVGTLLALLQDAGVSRLPADRRYGQRLRAVREGIRITADEYDTLMGFAAG